MSVIQRSWGALNAAGKARQERKRDTRERKTGRSRPTTSKTSKAQKGRPSTQVEVGYDVHFTM